MNIFISAVTSYEKETQTHKRHNLKEKTKIFHQNHNHLFNMLYAYSFEFISSCLIQNNIMTNIHTQILTITIDPSVLLNAIQMLDAL